MGQSDPLSGLVEERPEDRRWNRCPSNWGSLPPFAILYTTSAADFLLVSPVEFSATLPQAEVSLYVCVHKSGTVQNV